MKKEEDDDDIDEGGGESGGTVGEVVFRLPNLLSQQRDDLLPPGEIKRKFAVVSDLQKRLTEKQKERIKALKEKREGKTLSEMYENAAKSGYGGGYDKSPYADHPYLKDLAQFSGAESKVTPLVNQNDADTNEENKNKLENEYQNKLENQYKNQLQYQSRPLPKPKPY